MAPSFSVLASLHGIWPKGYENNFKNRSISKAKTGQDFPHFPSETPSKALALTP
jgi:hypothetical protein